MKDFVIKKGNKWAGNVLKRHWYGVSGFVSTPWPVTYYDADFEVEFGDGCPAGTTIKLGGITYVNSSMKRVKRGGWGELLSLSHEHSDRLLATLKKDGTVALRYYGYRHGKGPSLQPQPTELANVNGSTLVEVEQGQPFALVISRDGMFVYPSRTNADPNPPHSGVQTPDVPNHTFQHKTFAHAVGYRQPHAPSDITVRCKVNRPN